MKLPMADRSGRGRAPIWFAGALLIVAAAVFGAAFYFFDGVAVTADLIAGFAGSDALSPRPEPASASDALVLPKGMSEEFALGVWQEQVDSQRAIAPLVEGKVASLKITESSVDGDVATLRATLTFRDGTTAPGAIGLHRFDDVWYVTYVSANAATDEREQAKSGLPELADVDVTLLNTLIAEQAKGKAVTQDIVDGTIDLLKTGAVRAGPNTVTIPLRMREGDTEGSADLVAIKSESGGKEFWFLARFNETGSATK